jgi:hypothetical protein
MIFGVVLLLGEFGLVPVNVGRAVLAVNVTVTETSALTPVPEHGFVVWTPTPQSLSPLLVRFQLVKIELASGVARIW